MAAPLEDSLFRSRFEKLFQNPAIGFWISSLDGYLLEVNDTLAHMLGLSPQDLKAHPTHLSEFTPPEYVEVDRRAAIELIRTGVMSPSQKELLRRDGKRIWVAMGATLLRENPACVIGFALDISRQQWAIRELETSKALLLETQEVGQVGSWSYRVGTGELHFSRQAFFLCGFDPEGPNPAYETYLAQIHPEDRGDFHRVLLEAIESGVDLEIEHRILVQQEARWLLVRGRCRGLEHGAVEELVGTLQDVTHLEHFRQEKRDRERAEFLQAALFRISEAASSVDSIERFYASLHAIVSELLFARNFFVALVDEDQGLILFPYYTDEKDSDNSPIPRGGGSMTEYLLRSGEALLVNKEQILALASQGQIRIYGRPAESWLGVPLKWKDHVFGAVVVQSYQAGLRFQERDQDLLSFVARHLSTVLERRRHEAALRDSEARFRSIFENTSDLFFILRWERGEALWIEGANPAWDRIFGEVAKPRHLEGLWPRENVQVLARMVQACLDNGKPLDFTHEIQRPECVLSLHIQLLPLPGPDKGPRRLAGLAHDFSEIRRSEQAIQQAQKLESLGVLAGGIAHDFNNLLTAVLGNLNLAQIKLDPAHPSQLHLDNMENILLRAADLVRQMLTYSGKFRFRVKTLDLNQNILEMKDLLAASISKGASLEYQLAPEELLVEADPDQIQQLMLTLVTNASEAIEGEGRILLKTSSKILQTEDLMAFPGQILEAGRHVVVEVEDSGRGMDASVQKRIFDPFYSTKGTGRGLGLSALQGILKGHRGGVRVLSHPGAGSLFQIFLPAVESVLNGYSGSIPCTP